MFFNTKPLVVYLTSEYLGVFGTKDAQLHRFIYPKELVQHGEIVDEIKFKDALFEFLKPLVLRTNKGVILVSQKQVFSLETENTKNQSEEISKFLSAVPISKEDIVVISVRQKDKLKIYGTSKKVFDLVVSMLKQKNVEIYSITPLGTFTHKPMTQDLTSQEVNEMVREGDIIKQFNFLQPENQVAENSGSKDAEISVDHGKTPKNLRKQYIILLICLLLFGLSIAYLLMWSETVQNPWFKKVSVKTKVEKNTPSPTATLKPSPTLQPIDKSLISIQILNGSGIEGQAGKVGQILQDNGYRNIITGNAPDLVENTTLTYNNTLSSSDANSLLKIIKIDFPNATTQEASDSAGYDVVIITGKTSQ